MQKITNVTQHTWPSPDGPQTVYIADEPPDSTSGTDDD